MSKWLKESALKEIEDLIREADQVIPHGALSSEHIKKGSNLLIAHDNFLDELNGNLTPSP